MRSVLTLLGVVIGVTSVIAVVSLVSGLNRYVADKVFDLGADVFMVNRAPSIITNIDQWEDAQKRRKFHYDDYVAARRVQELRRRGRRACPSVGQVKYGTDYISDTTSSASRTRCRKSNARELAQGRYITQLDVSRAAPVCDVGIRHRGQAAAGDRSVGKELRVDTSACEIIGVGEKARLGDGAVAGQLGDHPADDLSAQCMPPTIRCGCG